jgi:hypothetical protein
MMSAASTECIFSVWRLRQKWTASTKHLLVRNLISNLAFGLILRNRIAYGWKTNVDYWTAASSDGINCGNKWAWCPNGTEMVASTMWGLKEPSNPFVDYCGVWKYQAGNMADSKLDDLSCNNEQQYICEVEKFR